ncbi:MAG: HEAT repeat domain-containing protein [Deltaproteobacteria bacterium]|nr:HEAT repeat domain-containing protein [Deltaproteobacteria bacterium]
MRTLPVVVATVLIAAPAAARDAIPRDASPKELLDYLKTGNDEARKEACKRLGARKDPSAIAAIGELVQKDPVMKVRAECIQALERIGPHPASAAIIRAALTSDPERKVREEAADSLQDVDPEKGGEVAAQVLAQEKEVGVRRKICNSIEHKAWKAADQAVAKVVSDVNESADLRRSCLQALLSIGSDAGYSIAHRMLLEEPNEDVRREASAQIEHHPKASSLEPLCKALKDPNSRVASNAAKGLKNLAMKEGAKCLREAAQQVKSDRQAGEMNKIAAELER